MAKRLTETHPFMQKINNLYEYMTENSISVVPNHLGGLDFTDTDNNKTYRLEDQETGEAIGLTFPTLTEFKLTDE